MKRPKPKIVDLSIDFDFFVREEPLWDWGHGEDSKEISYEQTVWSIRYSSSLLHIPRATAPERYADFQPRLLPLMTALAEKGVYMVYGKTGEFGYADSHKEAYPFFLRDKGRTVAERQPPDMLINIDAHHDCYNVNDELDCGNWLAKLMGRWVQPTRYIQLFPKWKEVEHPLAHLPLTLQQFKDWPGTLDDPHRIRHIFICRSGARVPPHLDPMFTKFLNEVGEFAGPARSYMYGDLWMRKCPSPKKYNEAYKGIFQDRAALLNITLDDLIEKAVQQYGKDIAIDLLKEENNAPV